MASGLQIKIDEMKLDLVMKKLKPDLISGPLQRFFKRSTITVQGKARGKAPVDLGRLRSDIGTEVDTAQPPLWGKIGTSVFYAPYQERGTGTFVGKGVHWPPGKALGLWAKRHGGWTGSEIASIIGHHGGLRPKKFMRGGLEDSLSAIRGFVDDLGREIEEKWRE